MSFVTFESFHSSFALMLPKMLKLLLLKVMLMTLVAVCPCVLVQTATFLTFIRLKRSDSLSASLNHPRMLQLLGTGSLRWDLELFNKLSNFRGRQNFQNFSTLTETIWSYINQVLSYRTLLFVPFSSSGLLN